MPYIEWSDDYKTGHREIDAEHWGLFALVNDLHDKLQAGAADASIQATIEALVAYVDSHFEREEALMAAGGYPDIEAHRQFHQRLKGRVLAYRDAYADDPHGFDYYRFMDFLGDWLRGHIMKEDMAYIPYLPEDAATQSNN